MSTIKVNKIENTATANGGIAIDSSGHVQVDGNQLPTAGPLSNRNLIINGAMTVAQRSTSETGQSTVNAYVTVDRYKVQAQSSGTFTISQSAESPDGFANSLKFDCTTADSSPNYLLVMQRLEGQDLQYIQKGTSSAQKLSASFYVRSSKTGTYQVNIRDFDNNRIVGATYAISSANTWEYKTVTFPADTTGAFDNDANDSLQIEWWLAAGSTYTGGAVPTTWKTLSNSDRAAGLNVDIGAATSDDFYITGVQLEVGEKATPFEHKSYGDELARCQRYFYAYELLGVTLVGGNTALCNGSVYFPVEMRAAPTLTSSSVDRMTNIGEANHNGTYTFGSNIVEKTHCAINYSRSSGDTWNQGTPLSINDTGGSTIMNINAEL